MVASLRLTAAAAAAGLLCASAVLAQVSPPDYERAAGLSDRYGCLTVNVPESATWIGGSRRFYKVSGLHGLARPEVGQ